MACCKTCCGCKDCTPGQAGKCCCGGAGGTCCTTAQTCCSGSCCDTVCCNGVCCPPGTQCRSGACAPVCAATGVAGCNFSGCYWYIGCTPGTTNCEAFSNGSLRRGFLNENAFETKRYFIDTTLGRCATITANEGDQSVFLQIGQTVGSLTDGTLTEGIRWKPGYPQALQNCIWRVVSDLSSSNCSGLIPAATSNPCPYPPFNNVDKFFVMDQGGEFTRRVRVLLVTDCNGTLADITDLAIEGGGGRSCYQSTSISRETIGCTCTPIYTCTCVHPADPPFLPFFEDPVFLCPP